MNLSPRILLVEDNLTDLQMLWVALRRAGLSLDAATTAGDGLWLARTTRYGAVIVSLEARLRLGLEFCAELRATLGEGTPLLLCVSAEAMPADLERAQLVGCGHYLTKPANLGQIVSLALDGVGRK
jgi:DNA-binding response OmpR family regulator